MPLLTAEDVKRLLALQPHPEEGGWFRRTYEAGERIVTAPRYAGPRLTGTAIYYLLEPDTFSEIHKLASDEIFHYYLGDPVELLALHANGRSTRHTLGNDLLAGHTPQLTVPRDTWQGSHLLPGPHGFALLGCTVSPGFEYEDYSRAPRAELIAGWPQEAELIAALTNY